MSKLQVNSRAWEANKWPKKGGERLQKGWACQQPYWNSTAAWVTACQCQGASWAHIFVFLRWNTTGTRMALLAEGGSHSAPQRATWAEYSQQHHIHDPWFSAIKRPLWQWNWFFCLLYNNQLLFTDVLPIINTQPGCCCLQHTVMRTYMASVAGHRPVLTVVLLYCETGNISFSLQAGCIFSAATALHASMCHAAE